MWETFFNWVWCLLGGGSSLPILFLTQGGPLSAFSTFVWLSVSTPYGETILCPWKEGVGTVSSGFHLRSVDYLEGV